MSDRPTERSSLTVLKLISLARRQRSLVDASASRAHKRHHGSGVGGGGYRKSTSRDRSAKPSPLSNASHPISMITLSSSSPSSSSWAPHLYLPVLSPTTFLTRLTVLVHRLSARLKAEANKEIRGMKGGARLAGKGGEMRNRIMRRCLINCISKFSAESAGERAGLEASRVVYTRNPEVVRGEE